VSLKRLDAELVRRGLARSREHARELIEAGAVRIAGTVATKAATQVDTGAAVTVSAEAADDYVSRGAHKLIGALDVFSDVVVEGAHCLDAGASTGGFTDVLLRRGAAHVLAVDVGYGQIAWRLRSDDRVTVQERVNIRDLTAADVPYLADITVADLSFISLELVLPALSALTQPTGEMLLMVKPQFEVGRELVGAGGVVREPELRVAAVTKIAHAGHGLGWGTAGVTASPLPGPRGNVEYFVRLNRVSGAPEVADIERAVEEGPQ
jgi:23S rRNA (cytidine1920-2'-O)/16S rRNA (cytidine1409-2'-O)-methyltransferase